LSLHLKSVLIPISADPFFVFLLAFFVAKMPPPVTKTLLLPYWISTF